MCSAYSGASATTRNTSPPEMAFETHGQPKPTILRLKQVIDRIGLRRSTIYAFMKPGSRYFDPTYPRAIRIGAKAIGFLESEISAWIVNRAAARQNQPQIKE